MIQLYIYNVLLATSQFINAFLLGDPDESISGRCGRALASGRPKYWVVPLVLFINSIFLVFGEKGHVQNSIEPEERPHEKELWRWYYAD